MLALSAPILRTQRIPNSQTREGGPADEERRGQVGADHEVPPLDRLLGDHRPRPDAGAHDERVETPEPLNARVDGKLRALGRAGVGADREPAGRRRDLLQRRDAPPAHSHRVPGARHPPRHGGADPGPAADDKHGRGHQSRRNCSTSDSGNDLSAMV